MKTSPASTEEYLLHGCGRCSLYDTPACKVHAWQDELQALLAVVRAHDLVEDIKWSVPCFSVDGTNILSVTAFKPHASLNFFLGSALRDDSGILVKPGENSRSARVFRCTDTESIRRNESDLHSLVEQSITVARSAPATKSRPRSSSVPDMAVPDEFTDIMRRDKEFAQAFERLTPGRRRGYLLHFGSAKQSETRTGRILKARSRVMEGKGMHDD